VRTHPAPPPARRATHAPRKPARHIIATAAYSNTLPHRPHPHQNTVAQPATTSLKSIHFQLAETALFLGDNLKKEAVLRRRYFEFLTFKPLI
jgi:hypothetical protein